jgi:hypothetical protein
MEIIFGSILLIVLLVGIIFIVRAKKRNEVSENDQPVGSMPDPGCCGAHEVCEFDLIKMNPDFIEYFDDEELDNYKLTPENNYTDIQIDAFREILYTLQKHEIRNWLLSLSRRSISLPVILQEEARQLLYE